jgi:hypothetical protein
LGLSWSAALRLGGFGAVLCECGRHEAETTRRLLFPAVGQRVAHGVDPAALPGGVHQLADGCLDALMGVGDGQLDAAQAAPPQLA